MNEEEKDVQAETSAATDTTDTGAVKPDTDGGDRPLKNLQAEFNRKFTKVERQNQQLAEQLTAIGQFLAANHQPQQAPAQRRTEEPDTDENLWARAQTGDRLAFEEYQRRIAQREVQKERTVTGRDQMIQAQMQALYAKYPVFNDGNHPLTQTAQQAYQLLVRNGYPANQATLLEAAKTAIADRPDLVSDIYSQGAQAREGARRGNSNAAHSGQTGASVRRDEPTRSREGAVTVRPGEAAIAKRMGIKDPQKAKERFLERQKSGQSALGAVSGFVHEEDF